MDSLLHVFKFNPAHDARGRFAPVGDGGPATTLLQREQTHLSDKEIIAKALPNVDSQEQYQAMVAKTEKDFQGRTSKEANTIPGTNRYTPERLALHRRIIGAVLGNPADHKPEPGKAPNVIFLGGRGGGGKSNFNRDYNPQFGVYSPKHYAALNADRIKEFLPEYTPANAAHVHAESVDILSKAATVAKKLGKNVTLDVTMKKNINGWVNAFKNKGYSTEAHFIHTPIDQAAISVVRRAMLPDSYTDLDGATHSHPTGRVVLISVVRENTHNESVFDGIRNKVDKWSLLDAKHDGSSFAITKIAEGHKAQKDEFLHVFKFNPNHDELGRFASSDSGPEIFGTSNTEKQQTFEAAVRQMNTETINSYIATGKKINDQLGFKATPEKGIGTWEGTSEAMVIEHVSGKIPADKLAVAAAYMGKLHDQDATLTWVSSKKGEHSKYTITMPGENQTTIFPKLKAAHAENSTVTFTKAGAKIQFIHTEPDPEKIATIAKALGATEVEEAHGTARFIDRSEYDSIIKGSEWSHLQKHDGDGGRPDSLVARAAAWQEEAQPRLIDVLKFDPNHDAKGKFAPVGENMSGWKKIKGQGGSNPGGVFEDDHGAQHYVKFPQESSIQANSEKLADLIYGNLGIPVKDSKLVTDGKRQGLAGQMLTGSKSMTPKQINAHPDVKKGYVADAYLGNWDVFGLTHDNILDKDGKAYRVDNGGTMFHRAQGKPKDFPADRVDELDSLVAPGKKGHAAYGDLSDDEKAEQAHDLVHTLTDEKLKGFIAESGIKGKKADEYLTALRGRRDVIRDKFLPAEKDEDSFYWIMKEDPYHDAKGKFTFAAHQHIADEHEDGKEFVAAKEDVKKKFPGQFPIKEKMDDIDKELTGVSHIHQFFSTAKATAALPEVLKSYTGPDGKMIATVDHKNSQILVSTTLKKKKKEAITPEDITHVKDSEKKIITFSHNGKEIGTSTKTADGQALFKHTASGVTKTLPATLDSLPPGKQFIADAENQYNGVAPPKWVDPTAIESSSDNNSHTTYTANGKKIGKLYKVMDATENPKWIVEHVGGAKTNVEDWEVGKPSKFLASEENKATGAKEPIKPQVTSTVKPMLKTSIDKETKASNISYGKTPIGTISKDKPWSYYKYTSVYQEPGAAPVDLQKMQSGTDYETHTTIDSAKAWLASKHAAYLNAHPTEIIKPKPQATPEEIAAIAAQPPKVLSAAAQAKKDAKDKEKLAKLTEEFTQKHHDLTIEAGDLATTYKSKSANQKINQIYTVEKKLAAAGATPEQIQALKDAGMEKVFAEKKAAQNAMITEYAKAYKATLAAGTPGYAGYGSEAQKIKSAAKDAYYFPHKGFHPDFTSYENTARQLVEAEKKDALSKLTNAHKVADPKNPDSIAAIPPLEAAAKAAGANDAEIKHAWAKVLDNPDTPLPKTKDDAYKAAFLAGVKYYKSQAYAKDYYQSTIPKPTVATNLTDAKLAFEAAKDNYVALGGEHGDLVKEKPSMLEAGKKEKYEEINAKEIAKDKALKAIGDAAFALEESKSNNGPEHETTNAKFADLQKAKEDAKTAEISHDYIMGQVANGQSKFNSTIEQQKTEHGTKLKNAAYDLEFKKAIKGEDDPATGAAANHLADVVSAAGKFITPDQVEEALKSSKEMAQAAKENYAKLAAMAPQFAETVAKFDGNPEAFKYVTDGKKSYGEVYGEKPPLEQRSVLSDYVGSGYRAINKAAGKAAGRVLDGKPPGDVSNDIKQLDALTTSHTIGKDMLLRRQFPTKYIADKFGLKPNEMHALSNDELQKFVGQTYMEDAFSSTSMNSDWTSSYSSATNAGVSRFVIRAPATAPGFRYGGGEQEVILARGATYVIRGIKKDAWGDSISMDVDLVASLPVKIYA